MSTELVIIIGFSVMTGGLIVAILRQGKHTMANLTALTAQVAQNTSVEQSALVLIQGLSAQLSAAGTDPQALASLQASLNTSATALAAAVVANTPAASSAPSTSP